MLPIMEMGKIIRQADLRRKIRSSLSDILNLRCLSDNQVEMLTEQLEVQVQQRDPDLRYKLRSHLNCETL